MLIVALLLATAVGQDAEQSRMRDPAPVLTPRQEAAIRAAGAFQQVYDNWTLSCDDPAFLGHRIRFDITIGPGGEITQGPTLIEPSEDAGWREAAESARLALVRTAPFDVPADFEGSEYRPTFNTSRACALAAQADEP